MKKLFGFLCLLVIVLIGVGCGSVKAEGIVITSENDVRNIKVSETLQLTAKVFPDEVDQVVKWSSEDDKLATVNEQGLVTAVSVGTVDIVATSVVTETISQTFTIIIEEAAPQEVVPTKVTIKTNVTTCKTGEKINLSAIVDPEDANQSVVWESSAPEIASVNRGEVTGLKEGKVTIKCTAKGYTDVYDSIELTIEKNEEQGSNKDWVTMDYCTHEEYMTAEKETPLKIKGVVTYVLPEKDNLVSYLIQNGTEGYYVYNQDAINFPVELGKVYEVGGFKKYYQGLNEIVNVEYFKALDEKIEYTVNKLENVNTSDLTAMEPFHCSIVTGKAVLTEVKVNTGKAHSFYAEIGNYSTQFRVDPNYTGTEEFANINNILSTAVLGSEFEFVGIMTAFGYGKAEPQIQIVKSADLKFAELTDEAMLEAAAENLKVATSLSITRKFIELPTTLSNFDNLTIEWSSNNEAINAETGAVSHLSENVRVTLTATLKYNGKELTKTVEVLVFALDTTTYEVLASLDLEDALTGGSYGTSPSKSSYKEGNVTLGNPSHTWILRNALIAGTGSNSDKYDGIFSIRAQGNAEASQTGRIEIQEDGEYNVVQFDVAIYGNDNTGIQIRIEYSSDSGATWTASEDIITVDSRELETYLIKLPAGNKRVAIVVVEGTGKRVNIDNIKLMK